MSGRIERNVDPRSYDQAWWAAAVERTARVRLGNSDEVTRLTSPVTSEQGGQFRYEGEKQVQIKSNKNGMQITLYWWSTQTSDYVKRYEGTHDIQYTLSGGKIAYRGRTTEESATPFYKTVLRGFPETTSETRDATVADLKGLLGILRGRDYKTRR